MMGQFQVRESTCPHRLVIVLISCIGLWLSVHANDGDFCTTKFQCPADTNTVTNHSKRETCASYRQCENGIETDLECPKDQTFDHDLLQCVSGQDCRILCSFTRTGVRIDCLFQKDGFRIAHPNTGKVYFECRRESIYRFTCPRKTRFDAGQQQCVDEPTTTYPTTVTTVKQTSASELSSITSSQTSAETSPTTRPRDVPVTPKFDCSEEFVCPLGNRPSFYSNVFSCTEYYFCRGPLIEEGRCEVGEAFKHDESRCVFGEPCRYLCEPTVCGVQITCDINGRMENPEDCETYFECLDSELFLRQCPEDMAFDALLENCTEDRPAKCKDCPTPIVPDTTVPTSALTTAKTSAMSSTTEKPLTTVGEDTTVSTVPTPVTSLPTPATSPDNNLSSTSDPQENTSPSDSKTTVPQESTQPRKTTDSTTSNSVTTPPTTQPDSSQPTSKATSPTSERPTTGSSADPVSTESTAKKTTTDSQTPTVTQVPTTLSTRGTTPVTTAQTVPDTTTRLSTSSDKPTSETTTAGGSITTAATVSSETSVSSKAPATSPSVQPVTTKATTTVSTSAESTTKPTSVPRLPTIQPESTSTAPVVETTTALVATTSQTTSSPSVTTKTGDKSTTAEVTQSPQTTAPQISLDLPQLPDDILESDSPMYYCRAYLPASQLEDRNLPLSVTPHIVWKLQGSQINDGGRVTIRTSDTYAQDETIMSNLTINKMRIADSGSLQCLVLIQDQVVLAHTIPVMVIGRPTVSLRVSLALVTPGEEITATCLVEVPHNSNMTGTNPPPVFWYKDEVFLGSIDNGRVFISQFGDDSRSRISSLSGGSELQVQIEERTKISCSALNSAGSSDLDSKVVNVLEPDAVKVYCEEEVIDGITWQKTLAGGELYQNCAPLNAEGEARRECARISENKASWINPEYTNCVSPLFVEIARSIERLEDTLGPINSTQLTETAKHLEEISLSRTPLLAGDVMVAIDVMANLVTMRQDGKLREVPVEEFEAVSNVVSNLLDDGNLNSWDDVRKDHEYAGVEVMKAVDMYTELLAAGVEAEGDYSFEAPNFVVMRKSMSKENIETVQFPEMDHSTGPVWVQQNTDNIILEKQTLDGIKDEVDGDLITLTGAYYKNLDKILPSVYQSGVNSRVLSMSINGLEPYTKLDPPVAMEFSTVQEIPSNMTNNCSFWDYSIPSKGAWSMIGCRTIISETGVASCYCDHLTNFAMLVTAGPVSEQDLYILSMISLVGCIISVVALVLTILFYATMWKAVKSHHAAVLINLCIALILGNLVFLVGVERTENKMVCTIVATLLHYFWLAAFFIMLVEGIQLLLYIIYVFHVRRKKDTAALLFGGWMVPALIVGVTLGITRMEGYGNDRVCWLSPESSPGLLYAFVGPMLLVVAINLVILFVVLMRAKNAKVRAVQKKKNKLRSAVWNICVITPLLGVTWVVGVFSVNEDTVAFQYAFVVCNSLQGLFIFIFHALCNKKKGRYALNGATTPSNQRKTTSGSGSKTTGSENGIKFPKSSKAKSTTNNKSAQNGHVTNGKAPSRMVGRPVMERQRSTMTVDLHSAPSYPPGTGMSNGTGDTLNGMPKPPLYHQLSEGSEVSSPHDVEFRKSSLTPSSFIPPSPTTVTTDVSWTSLAKDLTRTTSHTSA